MLHTEAVEPGTFSILRKLMTLLSLQQFSLVGGTALALRYGHRSSVDLELFFHNKFDHPEIIDELETLFRQRFVYQQQKTEFGFFCFIDNVKVDIIHFPHQPISQIEELENIKIYGSPDISAMKIQAVFGRAQKKDFWDIYELLQYFSLEQLIDWHKQKYPGQMLAISIPQAITYFVDAEDSESPISLKNQSWEQIKKGISKIVSDYLK
jgi:hypothetical protein